MTPRRIIGVEKNYDWGDEDTIRRSLGLSSTRGTKIAELWLGTHPLGSSHLDSPHGPPLRDIAGDMTMLVKLLSCEQPLSLQTHPTSQQAREGFAREEALGLPRDAPQRMYRDNSDKPEMIIALSRFEALCGFAPVETSVRFLTSLGWHRAADELRSAGISEYMRWAFQQSSIPSMTDAPQWLQNLAVVYPDDKALFIAPLLNHVVLNEGEALSLPAGNLHAYLHGFGLEVMNSSDNVIRAGFTSKHVDVNELLRIVDTNPLLDPIVHMNANGEFPSPSPAFSVGNAFMAQHHTDRHRIAFGKFNGNTHYDFLFMEAGSTEQLPDTHCYVCVQN
jgi:mannose-6-phosphate isomerase